MSTQQLTPQQAESKDLIDWFCAGIWRIANFVLLFWILCNVFDIARSIVSHQL